MAHNKDVKYVGDSRVPAERKASRPRPYSEFPGKTEPFFPNFLLKEWMVAVVVLIAFLILVVAHPAPLEPHAADPNDANYQPLPDWYFLFLYQFLKYFPGDWKVVGAVVIPGLAGLAFLLAPFLDRGPERRPSKRPISTGIMLVTVIGIVALTYLAIVEHEKALEAQQGSQQSQNQQGGNVAAGDDQKQEDTTDQNAAFDPAAQYATSCLSCHGANLEGGFGPKLSGLTLSADEIAAIMVDGKGQMPKNVFAGTEEERLALANWILEHK